MGGLRPRLKYFFSLPFEGVFEKGFKEELRGERKEGSKRSIKQCLKSGRNGDLVRFWLFKKKSGGSRGGAVPLAGGVGGTSSGLKGPQYLEGGLQGLEGSEGGRGLEGLEGGLQGLEGLERGLQGLAGT